MNLERIEREVNTQGFSIVEDIVSAEEIAVMKAELAEAIERDAKLHDGMPGKRYDIIFDMVTAGCPSFVKLIENEKMRTVFNHFLSDTCILYSYTSTFMLPNAYKQQTANIHVDAPRIIPNYHSGFMMTLALDEFTEENGATYYLAGSQNRPDRPSEDEFYANAVRVCRPAGAAVFFNPRCWHAGGTNHTDKIRMGATTYAVRSFMRQRFDFPRMVNGDVLSQLSDSGRQFLGFNVRVPTAMNEYYVPADQRLYKGGQG